MTSQEGVPKHLKRKKTFRRRTTWNRHLAFVGRIRPSSFEIDRKPARSDLRMFRLSARFVALLFVTAKVLNK